MEKSSFFNSINGDRKYKAEDFAAYFGSFISNGIFPNPADNLRVVSNKNMTVTLKPGKAWINGYFYVNDNDLILPIDVADGALDRIDRVVIRLDYVNREIRAAIKKGTFASSPVAPELQRDMDIYELCVAEIKVRKGAVSILQSDITDTRLNLELCGVTNSLITVDVGIITEQFSKDFTEWFERVKGQLGEDPAGNLQNQIDALNQNKISKEDFDAHKAEIATSTQLGHVKVGQNLAIDSDGTLHAQASGGKKVARFVIGTSTAGWTENDVDYLCDGIDDQAEINQAIQDLPADGGEIIILSGIYNIGAKIDVNKNNVTIRGNGDATILKRMWNSSSAEGVITLNGVSNCKIENLRIDGNRPVYTSTNNHGIYLNTSSNNTVTGNTYNNNNCGIYLYSSSNNTVTGNTCNNNNYGIHLNTSSNNTVTGNTYNNNYCGIYLYSSSNNNTVTGNTCNNNYGIYLYSSSNNNTVTGNTCNNNNYGIYLYSSSNNTVTGNTCIRGTGQSSDYTSSQYTIRLAGSDNNYNLISSNNCMGKDVVIEGGTGNTSVNNKYN